MKHHTYKTYKNKGVFVSTFISLIRENGGSECWILNKQNMEIYKIKATQITEFDIQIDLINSLTQELVISTRFVLHMKQSILELFEEVPGIIYSNKIEVYRELYNTLNEKFNKSKMKKLKLELKERIEFIENEFPELII